MICPFVDGCHGRLDRRQHVVPSAVFFMFDESGKIDSVWLYRLQNEAAEIA
jgi:hypothetical protein